jgi:hypothetical protein
LCPPSARKDLRGVFATNYLIASEGDLRGLKAILGYARPVSVPAARAGG